MISKHQCQWYGCKNIAVGIINKKYFCGYHFFRVKYKKFKLEWFDDLRGVEKCLMKSKNKTLIIKEMF